MPFSHYFSILEAERPKRFQKVFHYSKFLELLSAEENTQISQEFYKRFPSDEVFKPLNELLKEMVERQITPESVFVEALEDYFIFRIKSAALE
jgi:hypothetical protein